MSFITVYLCLLGLLTLGAYELALTPREERISPAENRVLQPLPQLTLSSVRSGSFMTDFDAFLSDAFPNRDGVVGLADRILGLFGGETEADKNSAMQAELEAHTEPATPEASGGTALPAATGEPVPEETPPPDGEGNGPVPPEGASLWFITEDGETETVETYPLENLRVVADALEQYRAQLPEDGEIHFINVPVAQYGKVLFRHSRAGWDSDIDEVLQGLAGPNTYIYDETEILGDAVFDQPVYSAGDHHWYPMAAWMTMAAMVENQGIPATDYYEYLYKVASNFYGEPLTKEQLEVISPVRASDDIQALVPISPVESYIVKHLTELSPSAYMEEDKFAMYGIYLGGRRGPYRYFVTGYHTGRNALVIGDSFYMAFIPYLTPYYDNILATDLRDDMYNLSTVGPDVSHYMEEYDIDDIYFVTCTLTSLNGYVFQDRLTRYLHYDTGE